MNEETTGRRIVLTSLPLTALFTAAVLFFGLRYAESEPLVFPAAALILRQTDAGIRAAESFISYDIVLTPDTLTETPKDVQISQLGRLYRQKPLIFRYTAEQIHADSQL